MLTDEQNRMLRELHAAMCKRTKPTVGAVVSASKPKYDASDPIVKFLPRSWVGTDMKGKRYSECTPKFLHLLAGMLDNFAEKKENAPDPDEQSLKYASWDRGNARAARTWAARLEGRTHASDNGAEVDALADSGAL